MLAGSSEIADLTDLRQYIKETLASDDQLVVNAFSMSERILIRGEQPCGIYFCLHGPRAVKYTAIWETDSNSVLFYGSSGERFHRTQLIGAPILEAALN